MNMQYFWICDQKPSKTFSLHEKQDKKILQNILRNITLKSIINVYFLSIHRQIKRHVQSRLSYLRGSWLEMITTDSNTEHLKSSIFLSDSHFRNLCLGIVHNVPHFYQFYFYAQILDRK